MTFKGGDVFSGLHIPQLDRVISCPGREGFSHRAKNATELTPCVCPSRVAMFFRVFTSHNLIVLSAAPEASSVPSGENATELTPSVCLSRVAIIPLVSTSHNLIVPSSVPRSEGFSIGRKMPPTRPNPSWVSVRGHETSPDRCLCCLPQRGVDHQAKTPCYQEILLLGGRWHPPAN